MTAAYSESYLDDAMQNLGDMLDYAVNDCGYDAEEFFSWFITSGIATKFENGNPRYISGMSGVELAEAVLKATDIPFESIKAAVKQDKSPEYWAGWILAYYQWESGIRFSDIIYGGLTISKVLSMYLLHEADVSKFVEEANQIIEKNKSGKPSKLKQIRKARGFTQKQLSDASGVALRMVQLYEQRQNDIGKAQVTVVLSLAKALGCDVEDLLQ